MEETDSVWNFDRNDLAFIVIPLRSIASRKIRCLAYRLPLNFIGLGSNPDYDSTMAWAGISLQSRLVCKQLN